MRPSHLFFGVGLVAVGVTMSCRTGDAERTPVDGTDGAVASVEAAESPVALLTLTGGVDLQGEAVSVDVASRAPTLLIFVRTDCPIANRYAPEITRIAGLCEEAGGVLWLIYPEDDDTEQVAKHQTDYALPSRLLLDPEHQLVRATGVTVTPEVALYRDGALVYRGRIDDRFVDWGVTRAEPTQRDVREALEALAAGDSVTFESQPAIGCPIPPRDESAVPAASAIDM